MTSTFGILVALFLNLRANKAAVKSAETAVEALGASRAWVVADGVEKGYLHMAWWTVGCTTRELYSGLGFRMRAKSCRSGRPVHGFQGNRVDRSRAGVPPHAKDSDGKETRAILANGQVVFGNKYAVAGDDLVGFFERKKCVALYASVVYRDVFSEKRREAEFCCRITYNGSRTDDDGRPSYLHDIIPEGRQNRVI